MFYHFYTSVKKLNIHTQIIFNHFLYINKVKHLYIKITVIKHLKIQSMQMKNISDLLNK